MAKKKKKKKHKHLQPQELIQKKLIEKNKKTSTTLEGRCELSVGMIVKNEEKYLERCLQALQPLRDLIDMELIITDTGSTDRTIEIAKKYADVFLEFEWCDDFSAARNTGVEVARGLWFMYVDADEIFDESIKWVAEFIKHKDRDTCASAIINLIDYADEQGTVNYILKLPRLVNMVKEKFFFYGAIHEKIKTHSNDAASIDVNLHHYGSIASALKQKSGRNEKILNEMIEKNTFDIQVRKEIIYGTGDLFLKAKLCEEALAIIENSKVEEVQIPFLILELCKTYPLIGRFDDFERVSEEYLKKQTESHLPNLEILYVCAVQYYDNNLQEKGIAFFEVYLKMFLEIEQTKETRYITAYMYAYNTKTSYITTSLTVANYYFKQKNYVRVCELLKDANLETYKDIFNKSYYLFEYISLLVRSEGAIQLVPLYKKIKKIATENQLEIFKRELVGVFKGLPEKDEQPLIDALQSDPATRGLADLLL
ncbi:MAG: glycosyltransferase family 2 protein [Bacillota bacterium]